MRLCSGSQWYDRDGTMSKLAEFRRRDGQKTLVSRCAPPLRNMEQQNSARRAPTTRSSGSCLMGRRAEYSPLNTDEANEKVTLKGNGPAGRLGFAPDAPLQPGEGVKLQDFVAFMQSNIYIFRPSGDYWPANRVDARVRAVPLFSINGNPIIDQDTKKQIVSKASNWLAKHAPVEQMTWAPGWPQLIRDKLINNGGWIDRKGVTIFNLYRPPTLVHGDASKAGPWIDHVKKIYPDEADHII